MGRNPTEDMKIKMTPASKAIYFVCLFFSRCVHAQALGFTTQMFHYARAVDEKQAKKIVWDYYQNKYERQLSRYDTEITGASATLAYTQDPERYASDVLELRE